MDKEILNKESNIRLDSFLSNNVDALSRTKLKKLIQNGHITVDNYIVKPSYVLKGGESIYIKYVQLKTSQRAKKENMPLDIIYEDECIVIINKESGIVVHPGAGNLTGTLLNGLLFHFSKLSEIDITRPGIVHRLDKNTSGIIIIAKTDEAHYHLGEQFINRKINKTYRAIVWGKMTKSGSVEGLIRRKNNNRTAFSMHPNKGKYSLSLYKLLDEFNPFSYIELNPITGRTHQLRVHMESIGHPIILDETYNGGIKKSNSFHAKYKNKINNLFKYMDRFALHAFKISFIHPLTKQRMTVKAPIQDDFKHCLKFLKLCNEK